MTRAQERAAARRRWEKQQAAAAAKAADRARTIRTAVVVLVVLALVGTFVLLSNVLGDSSASTAEPATTPAATATTNKAGCPTPPDAYGTGAKLTLPDKKAVAGKTVTATLVTSCGNITLSLDAAKAPQAVASFVQLAQQNYWNNGPCHRLTTSGIFVLQCGDPTGTGTGSPGYGFGVENAPKNEVYPRGTLAMARTQDAKKGNGGQFFLVYKDSTIADPQKAGYTIFGKITGGLDIVDKIAAAGVADGAGDGPPAAPISILRVTVTEKKA